MNYILSVISMFSGVARFSLSNHVGKNSIKTERTLWRFTAQTYLITFLIFFVCMLGTRPSAFTLLLGLAFGTVTMVHSVLSIKALARGPMHIINLIIMSALVVPSLSDAVLKGTPISPVKLVAVFVLLFFIYLSLAKEDSTETKRGWLAYTLIVFVLEVSICLMQKIHQESEHAAETAAFLAAAFFAAVVLSAIMTVLVKKTDEDGKTDRKAALVLLAIALISGVCVYLNNDLNLKLSGRMPSQIFFPLMNGGMLFLNTLSALVIFKEKLTKKQIVGLAGGIATLILICILP